MMKKTFRLVAFALVVAIAMAGCRKKEEVVATPSPAEAPPAAVEPAGGARVERITVVKAVNPDDSPGEAATMFGRNDTVYVSMWTAGAPVGTEVTARWIGPDGQQVTEDKIVTDRAGDGYTSFHAANTAGWAPGTYRVEILLNGQSAGSTTFTVQ